MRIPKPVTGASLQAQARQAIWDFARRFIRISRNQFEQDLDGSELVYVLRDALEQVSGVFCYRIWVDDAELPTRTILHGDWALLDPALRRLGVPQRCLLDAFWRCKCQAPLRPLWFIFGSGTFRSYLMCARTTAIFWPKRRSSTPQSVIRVRDRAMGASEGSAYDAARGLILSCGTLRFLEWQPRDNAESLNEPDVAAWFGWNPGFRDGDQLVVVVPMTAVNMVASGLLMLSRRCRELIRRCNCGWRRVRHVSE